ncbi:hypothetical protein [Hujiaoplasma nucleasis]|nr:hypothetical protein [Hujiaoplasma nucleasis]
MKEREFKLFKVQEFGTICPNEYWNQLQNNYHIRQSKLRKDYYG